MINRKILGLLICVLVFGLFSKQASAQTPTVQDCDGAIPVCQNVYYESNAYLGEGNIPDEINDVYSCLGTGENNAVWYIFTTQTAGNVCFTITPNDPLDDYDWAVYNLTNNDCSEIYTNPSLEISCNYHWNPGNTGPNGNTGWGNPQNEACIPVLAGETYVVNVSQFSTSTNGYTLDFSASTATIFDNVDPLIQAVSQPITCGSTTLSFNFSENILCSSVQDADFTLTGPGGPYTISAVTGAACAAGANQENNFSATISPALSISGTYSLCLVSGSGFVEDLCGNLAPAGCLNFTITNPIVADAGSNMSICSGTGIVIGGSPTGSGSSGYTYSWSPNSGLNNPNIANPTASPNTSTTYTVTVTDGVGCSDQASANININALTTPTFNPVGPYCSGESIPPLPTTSTNGISGTWSPAINNTTTTTYTFTPTSTTIPTCAIPTTITIAIDILTNPTFNPVGPYCSKAVIPDLPTTSINNITGNWIPAIENTKTTVYTFIPNDTTCYNKINKTIIIKENPVAGMLFNPQPTDIDNPDILFKDNSNQEILTSVWNLGDGKIVNNELDFWHTYTDTGTYTIKYYITNLYGCTDSTINTVTILPVYSIYIPNAFTPNGDMKNESFGPDLRAGGYKFYNIKIYSRWGEVIYNKDNQHWDGTINDNLAQKGVYSYSITVNDFKNRPFIYTGLINLIR